MKANPYYSVIIPVYNVEKNIKRCVESVLAQSFEDFELILVDDGSSDNSGELCEKYATQDERIIVIHQKNQGVSVARNEGLKKATGKYVVFIDSDDFVKKDLLYNLNQSDTDLVLVGFSDFYDNKVTKNILSANEHWEINSDEGILKFLKTSGAVFVWGKRYKKSIIDENNIKFRDDMKFSEDIIFNNDYILKTHTVVNIEWSGYYHCQYMHTTLSSIADLTSFCEKSKWRQISYEQFVNHPEIQKVYASQMLYFAEKEIILLSNKKKKFLLRHDEVKKIVNDAFFKKCIKLLPEMLPFDTRLFCRCKLVTLLILKYKKIKM